MMIKSYALIWAVMIAIGGGIFFTGMFTEFSATMYGFVLSTLLFAGIIGVLPSMMEKHYDRHIPKEVYPREPLAPRRIGEKGMRINGTVAFVEA